MQLESKLDLVPNLIRGRSRDGRNLYGKAAKRELVRRVMEPGVSLAATALAHGINANVLRKWVVKRGGKPRELRRALARPAAPAALVAVEVAKPVELSTARESCLEILVGGATVRIRGRVDVESLRAVLDCLAARA
jgi:transposase